MSGPAEDGLPLPPDPPAKITPAGPSDPVAGVPAEEAIPSSRIPYVDLAGTAALLVTTLAAWGLPGQVTDMALLVTSVVLFAGGSAAFAVGFVRAIGRSRYEVIHLAGLFYLTGTAPRVVRDSLMRLWFLQIGLATLGAFVTHPPFGVMAPVWGIGMLTLWGARHGRFPARAPSPRGRR